MCIDYICVYTCFCTVYVYIYIYMLLVPCVYQGVFVYCGQGSFCVLLSSTVCAVTCCARGFGITFGILAVIKTYIYSIVLGFESTFWSWYYGLQQLYKGGGVTMWCPVFLQTEDKVGVSALTESRTCCRPYTDNATHTHAHTSICPRVHSTLILTRQIHNTNPLHG